MNPIRPSWPERSLWLVVIAALSTSLLWLAVVCVVALSHATVFPPQTFVLIRAFASVIGAVVAQAGPVLLLVASGGLMLAFAVRGLSPLRREVRRD